MRHFFHLLFHEIRMLWISPATYVATVLFLLLMAFIYVFYLFVASVEVQDVLVSEWFFQSFFWPVFFMVPLLTMKSIAEERRLGTLETLMTTPATAFQIVLSKFIAIYLFYIGIWALTLTFPYIVEYFHPGIAEEGRLLDRASLIGGYAFIALSGTLYIALGIFTSSLTRSQLVAGMLSFSLLFIIIVSGQLLMKMPVNEMQWLSWIGEPLDYLRTFKHLEDFSRGIIDTRPFVLYLSNALLLVGITALTIEAKV